MCVCRNYEKGTIIKIRCKDFMVCKRHCPLIKSLVQIFTPSSDIAACTSPDSWCAVQTYKEATFRPSPRLNLILAPNGQPHVLTDCLQIKAAPLHAMLCILPAFQSAWASLQAPGRAHSHVPWPWALQLIQR